LSNNNKNDFANGLICLKGGDLAQEISESDLRPRQIALDQIFVEDYFKEKYLLYIAI
jgi:16S rRNA (guanine527-N7)-methyltransferase